MKAEARMLNSFWVIYMFNGTRHGGLVQAVIPEEAAKAIQVRFMGCTGVTVYDPYSHRQLYATVSRGPATVYLVDFKNRKLLYKAAPQEAPSVA